MKISDVIEAVNGKKITGDLISGEQINVKTLTVLRNGETKEIVLQIN